MADFTHIRHWIFDLDNTLYPAECHLFQQIDARMVGFIVDRLGIEPGEARKLQKQYYATYGTTLAGLMKLHHIRPEDFLDYVHDIDLSVVEPCNQLHAAISTLPGDRYIFTNGSVQHAENVAGKLGILDLFHGIFDISHAEYIPKPERETYERFNVRFDVTPEAAVMFEDLPQNLLMPHAMGQTTVLVQSDAQWFDDEPEAKRPARKGETFDHVHHITDDLASFLGSVKKAA